jgi:hypothetical protein
VDKITAIKLACEDLEKSIEDLLDDTNDDENIAVKKLNFVTEQLNLSSSIFNRNVFVGIFSFFSISRWIKHFKKKFCI